LHKHPSRRRPYLRRRRGGHLECQACPTRGRRPCDSHCPELPVYRVYPADDLLSERNPLRAELGWSIDIDEFRRLLRPNTRIVGLNFPNDPTGANVTHDVFAEIIEICRVRGIHILNDGLPHIADRHECGLSLNVTSKAYGYLGLRVGWIASKDRAAFHRHRHHH